jgi:hypothetical protein
MSVIVYIKHVRHTTRQFILYGPFADLTAIIENSPPPGQRIHIQIWKVFLTDLEAQKEIAMQKFEIQ